MSNQLPFEEGEQQHNRGSAQANKGDDCQEKCLKQCLPVGAPRTIATCLETFSGINTQEIAP